MSDRATLYRLIAENNTQAILDLYDMVVDEYVTDTKQLRARIAALEATGDEMAQELSQFSPDWRCVRVWRKLREAK